MAQKSPKGQKRKTTPRKEAREETAKVVLVGTYKGDQLTRWRGWYNYPISEGDFNVGTPKGGENKQTDLLTPNGVRGAGGSQLVATGNVDAMNCVPPDFSHINELWLFNGTKDQKTFKAEFVGVKTREELIRDYGYPGGSRSRATAGRAVAPRPSKPHGTHYALFKTELLYRHKNALPDEAERVIVRTADFARSPKVRRQLKAYLESPDRNNPDLAKRLPSIITRLRLEQLRVCEAAVQYRFLQWTPVVGMSSLLGKIESIVMSIGEFGRAHSLSSSESYAYLKKHKGLDYLDKYHEPLSCLPMEALVDDLTQVCRNNGGTLR